MCGGKSDERDRAGDSTQPQGDLESPAPRGFRKTVAKEGLKAFVGRVGSAKYSMHAENRVLRDARLRDGRSVVEFIRSNPHWGGVSSADNSDGLADVLDAQMLDTLVDREGVCLLYTHMGRSGMGANHSPCVRERP